MPRVEEETRATLFSSSFMLILLFKPISIDMIL